MVPADCGTVEVGGDRRGAKETRGATFAATAPMAKWLKCILAVALAAALPCACGSTPTPPINPQDKIQSKSPDDLPPTQTSGLGTPGGQVDAGLPHVAIDGGRP